MSNRPSPIRSLIVLALVIASCLAWLSLSSRPAWTDDRDLLRFNTAKPYIFIILDTSASMALKMGPGNDWVPGGADSPDSRLYQAKQALYDVFKGVTDLHFGFASYNQDFVHVVNKHWIYFPTSAPVGWPISFPKLDSNGVLTTMIDTLEDTDGDGIPDTGDGILDTRVGDIDGDVLTLGPHLNLGTPGVAETCATALDLDDPVGRARAQSFAIEADATVPTVLWVEEGGQVYHLEIRRVIATDTIGVTSPLLLHFHLRPATCPSTLGSLVGHGNFTFEMDGYLNEYLIVDEIPSSKQTATGEGYAGLWDWTDIVSQADFSSNHPFTGRGWESNYDSNFTTGNTTFDNKVTNDDPFFCQNRKSGFGCAPAGPKPVENTTMGIDPKTGGHAPALDTGDMIPFDWQVENLQRFIERLAPNVAAASGAQPEFRVAPYYQDFTTTVGGTPIHALKSPGVRPLAAADLSPLAKTFNDARCWYLGQSGRGAVGKCAQSAFFDRGWESYACEFDSEYGCRRPFFIAISDGEETDTGEDATADIGALNSQSGIQTWAINLGDPTRCNKGGGLHPVITAGKGDCLSVSNRAELVTVLKSIVGQIREATRSFASAAVPSVQATVEQKIFLTSFTPLNDESVWDGHVFSFLKPLPLAQGTPDRQARCDGSGTVPRRNFECLLWDAGEELQTQVASPALDLRDPNKRRVFYARQSLPGAWSGARELFDPINCAGNPPGARCLDLLDGMGLLPTPVPLNLSAEETRANDVIKETLALKSADVDVVDPVTGATSTVTINYILGDTFHSTPLVVGTPPSSIYFASDLFTEKGDPTASCDSGLNLGYRCFFRKHQHRRRLLMVGSDEGMLHSFDSGNFRTSGSDPITGKTLQDEFDNGLGKEAFAYMPRAVLPTVRDLAETDVHQYTVDGPLAAADVFIDPVFTPALGPDVNDREWRTVVVGGLRRGGSAVYALDVTQPDYVDFQNGIFEPDDNGDYIPSCLSDYNAGKCGPVPFPAPLWEFTDSVEDPINGPVLLDEDANGIADLGDTWSIPAIGRIQVCAAGGSACKPDDPNPANRADVEDRFVAIFGGGMDVQSKVTPSASLATLTAAGSARRGNWIYMVDIETGQVLYKRQVIGAAPSEIAAVDTDQNGVFDRLYVGTIAGLMYRVDIGPDSNGDVAEIDATPAPVLGMDGNMHNVPPRVETSEWVPRVLFDTLGNASALDATQVRRPFYFRPSVFFIAKLGLYGLGVGSGDREDLWSVSSAEGRFWVFVDDTNSASSPLDEAPFQRIDLIDADTSTDFLLDPARAAGSRGWYLALGENERVITDAFALSGITIFSSFDPRTDVVDANGNPVQAGCGVVAPGGNLGQRTCSKVGNGNIFAVNTTNANALLQDLSGNKVRSVVTSTYVSNPFAEPGSSKNPSTSGSGQTADDLDQRLIDIMNSLKGLFPTNCKFANYRIDVKTVAADTSLQFIAPIPVCIVEKNWKEF